MKWLGQVVTNQEVSITAKVRNHQTVVPPPPHPTTKGTCQQWNNIGGPEPIFPIVDSLTHLLRILTKKLIFLRVYKSSLQRFI